MLTQTIAARPTHAALPHASTPHASTSHGARGLFVCLLVCLFVCMLARLCACLLACFACLFVCLLAQAAPHALQIRRTSRAPRYTQAPLSQRRVPPIVPREYPERTPIVPPASTHGALDWPHHPRSRSAGRHRPSGSGAVAKWGVEPRGPNGRRLDQAVFEVGRDGALVHVPASPTYGAENPT